MRKWLPVLIVLVIALTVGVSVSQSLPLWAAGRETRTVGVVTITADTFTDMGGGLTRAEGNVWLGDHFKLAGADDYVTFDSTTINGVGTLAFRLTGLELFSGDCSIAGEDGTLTPGTDLTYRLAELAGFGLDPSLSITTASILDGSVSGHAGLIVDLPGVQKTIDTDFTLDHAGLLSGHPPDFDLPIAGATLHVSGAVLDETGISAATITLALPDRFGGGTVQVNDLQITPDDISLGQAGAAFDLPDVQFGDGSKLKLTNNQASLVYDSVSNAYQLAITTTLSLNLPQNQQNIAMNVSLASVNGQPQLSGTLDNLSLNVAGTTLAMTDMALNNSGLSVRQATLTLPPALGSAQASVYAVSITGSGLTVGDTNARFSLPRVQIGDGDEVSLQRGMATLAIEGDAYRLDVTADLVLTLPENQQTVAVSFSLDDGQVSGTLDALSLSVAGATLALQDVALSNAGLAVATATLTLPQALGGASVEIANVTIGDSGLAFGSAGADFALPDIAFGGDGTAATMRVPGLAALAEVSAPALSLTSNRATLDVLSGGSGYRFQASGTLNIDLPGNVQSRSLTFSLAYNAQSRFLIQGQLDALTLIVAGSTLQLTTLTLNNSGFAVQNASLSLPASLGGASVALTDVSITGAGLVVGSGRFALPNITLAGGKLNITGVDAGLEVANGLYRLSAEGTMTVNLPENAQTVSLTFGLDSGGNLQGTLSQLSLDIAGSMLAMQNLELNNDGLRVATATLSLPSSLGGSVTLSEVSITGAGLNIGSGTFALPDITFGGDGSRVKVGNSSATLEVSGDNYRLQGQGALMLRLPNNSQNIALQFTVSGGQFDASLSGVNLTVAGMTLALQNINFDNSGLLVGSATITMPAGLGGASGALQDVKITEDGLVIGGGRFALPEIKIGDGSKVKISNITAELAMMGSDYTLLASGALNLNLPGNAQNIAVSFSVDSSGAMQGSLNQLQLALAGSTLTMEQVVLNNSGLAVSVATLQLPSSLGGASGTVNDVRITEDGLTFGGGAITLPDIKVGDGSRVKLNNPTATIAAATGGYTFSINGTLQLRLPQNSQDITITASMNTAGQISATLSQLTLKAASLNLRLTNVLFNNSGLSVAQGTLQLPASLGGASGTVSNVTIDKDGLHIGEAGATFPFPDFKLGGSSGFSVTGVQATLAVAGDRTYKLTLVGTVAIAVPGSSASASGTVVVDGSGSVSGSVSAFSLTVAGLQLQAADVQINGDTLSVGSASLKVPSQWGGASAAAYNVTVTPGQGVQIGGGAFTLPDIQTGGFTVKEVHGSLKRVGNGYEIGGGGKFGVPGLGGGGSCAIGVDVTVYVDSTGATVLELSPPAGYDLDAKGFRKPLGSVGKNIPESPTESPTAPAGLHLRDVHLGLYGCTIPIGNTGFGLTRVEGRVTLSSGSTRIQIGVSVESTALRVAGYSALRGDVDMSMATNPAEFGLAGSIYVFAFHAGQLNVKITESDGFRGTLWIEAIVARGRFSVHAWSRYGNFHLTGSATIEIGIPRGKIASFSMPYPCCTSGWRWVSKWYGGYWKFWIRCSWCQTSVVIPPGNWILGNVNAEFGEFRVSGGGSAYGFKGWVSVMGYGAGFYVDSRGRLTIGNVDRYRLVDSLQVRQALETWQMLKQEGRLAAGEPWEHDDLNIMPNGDVIVSVPVTTTTDVIFALSRNSDRPAFSLTAPDGTEITPDNLPANVAYSETVTATLGIPPRMAALAGLGISQEAMAAGASRQVLEQPLDQCEIEPVSLADPSTGSGQALTGEPQGRMRIVHASPEAPAVDVLLDGAPIYRNVQFTQATDYLPVAVGSHTLQVMPAGATQPVFINTSLSVEKDADYTVVLLGELTNIEPLVLTDDNSLPAAGQTRVRFVHAAPDAPTVDLVLENGPDLFANVPYKSASTYQSLDAGTYNLELRASDTMTRALSLAGVELAEGTVNTMVLMPSTDGEPDLQVITSVDARRATHVRVVHAAQDAPALDVLVDGVRLFSSVPVSATTEYIPLEAGTYSVEFVPAETTGPALVSTTMHVDPKKEYTLVVLGDLEHLQTLVLTDDNTLPEPGQVRLRFVHVSPNAPAGGPALDLVVQDGPTWFSNVPFTGATDYLAVPAGAYTLMLRLAGTSTDVLTAPDLPLEEGAVYTIFAMTGLTDGEPYLQPVVSPDALSQRITQAMYTVHQAQAGTWRVRLSGDIGPDDEYLLSALGSDPPPVLSEVRVDTPDPETASVHWRLRSDDPDTLVDIYATRGPITYTAVITRTDGTTTTQEFPLYTGSLLAESVTSPVDGSRHAHTLDLSELESGTYWLWLEAEDGRNPPVRTYAPDPIVVTHPEALGGPGIWDADIEVTPVYRRLAVQWDRHPHPDVDGYVLHVGTTPLSASRPITVEDATVADLAGLDPGRTYYLSVGAYDNEAGEIARSREVAATTEVAGFDMSGPSDAISVIGGHSQQVRVTLTTPLSPYPATVGLSVGCIQPTALPYTAYLPLIMNDSAGSTYHAPYQSARPSVLCSALDGISIRFANTVVTPAPEGTPVSIAISTTDSLPGGEYVVPILARGGGVTRTLDLRVVVLEPKFTLQATPEAVTLAQGESTQVVISASRSHGEGDPIHLDLRGAPAGLAWKFSREVVYPGKSVKLTLTDTGVSGHGQYELHVVGEDGENRVNLSLPLIISEPDFDIQTAEPRLRVLAGETAVFVLDVAAQHGWSEPVTLTVDAQSVPPQTTVGFLETPPSPGGRGVQQGMQDRLVVTPPARAYVAVVTAPNTPEGLYLLRVLGEGDRLQRSILLQLEVYEERASRLSE
ncbi:MAG: DUF4397 domain-containing protein [Anaerolineae bacterium]